MRPAISKQTAKPISRLVFEDINTVSDRKNIESYIRFNRDLHMTIGENDQQLKYESKKGSSSRAIKWGQLKLLRSELQFINIYVNFSEHPNPKIVYVGAASGVHINCLSELYPQIEWFLYDKPKEPFSFSDVLFNNQKIHIYEKYFDDEDVEYWKNQEHVYFISDIRTLTYEISDNQEIQEANERIVIEDMRLQERWVKEINPIKALLKFRLPYDYAYQQEKEFEYLDGLLFLQCWTSPTSSEVRLVPHDNIQTRRWNITIHERQMFHHNLKIRNLQEFLNPLNDSISPIKPELGLTNDYDSTLTCVIAMEYLKKHYYKPDMESVLIFLEFLINGANNGRKTLLGIRSGLNEDNDENEDS